MTTASKILGTIGLIIMIIGLIPLFGWLNYISITLAIIGLLIGIFGKATGGLTLNGIVLIVGILRLFIGGGIF